MAAIIQTRSGVDSAGKHLIGSFRGTHAGPTLIIMGGIHGNEPAGVLAARRVVSKLEELRFTLGGEVVLLAGNTRALERDMRYVDADLNRLWTSENVQKIKAGTSSRGEISEALEQRELLGEIEAAIARARGEIFFVDLHTTSAPGKPFATVGDTLRNRRFALNFPVTIVLGLEEQIDGTLLEYANNLGLITLGLEAGQHLEPASANHHEATIWIACQATGNLGRHDIPEFEAYYSLLARATGGKRVVEVRYRHAISPEENFRMEPGFNNFQPVAKGQVLARDRNGEIASKEKGLVLLPLYQSLGDDGFFVGRRVKRFWLRLSALLRRMRVGDFVHLLPGVTKDPLNDNFIIIDTRVARILPLQVFHLLGFRKRRWSGSRLVVSRRAHDLQRPPIQAAVS